MRRPGVEARTNEYSYGPIGSESLSPLASSSDDRPASRCRSGQSGTIGTSGRRPSITRGGTVMAASATGGMAALPGGAPLAPGEVALVSGRFMLTTIAFFLHTELVLTD